MENTFPKPFTTSRPTCLAASPPKHPLTGEPLRAADLEPLFPAGFVAQETSLEREIPIPAPVRSAYSRYRPTPWCTLPD